METKVSVELHRQSQGNHCGDRPPDLESGVLSKPVAVLSSQPQEQRKGTSEGPCYVSGANPHAAHGAGAGVRVQQVGVRGSCGEFGLGLDKSVRTRLGAATCSTPSIPNWATAPVSTWTDLVATSLLPGILKNKVTYPPPLPEQPLKCRLREKLADCEQSPSSSRTSSLGSGDGVRATDCVITIKTPRREPGREHLNGVAMNVCTGSAQANGSDSE